MARRRPIFDTMTNTYFPHWLRRAISSPATAWVFYDNCRYKRWRYLSRFNTAVDVLFTGGVPETGLYSHGQLWVMHSILDDLCGSCYENLFSYNATGCRVREKCQEGEVAWIRLQVEVCWPTLPHPWYWGISSIADARLLFRRHEIRLQFSSVRVSLFRRVCDQDTRTIDNLTFHFGTDNVPERSLVEGREKSRIHCVRPSLVDCDLIIESCLLRCRFLCDHGCNVTGKWLHYFVRWALDATTEIGLRLVNLGGDVEVAGTSSDRSFENLEGLKWSYWELALILEAQLKVGESVPYIDYTKQMKRAMVPNRCSDHSRQYGWDCTYSISLKVTESN